MTSADDDGHGLVVGFSDGTSVRADLAVNCTGRSAAPEPGDDPLVGALLARGLARPGPLGLGFATHPDGRLVAADGWPAWTLGSLRRGELWESTAIPEIRDQAGVLARSILAEAATPARAAARTR